MAGPPQIPLRPRRSMRRFIRYVVIAAALAGVATTAVAQRGGRGADSTGGRGAGLPLQPTKPLKFTTDEGTWLSLDLSPDGRTIVFELLGDIYTIPVDGGKATRLTSGQPFDAQPHYSPDGKSIVFVSDRSQSDNLWIMNADGTNPARSRGRTTRSSSRPPIRRTASTSSPPRATTSTCTTPTARPRPACA